MRKAKMYTKENIAEKKASKVAMSPDKVDAKAAQRDAKARAKITYAELRKAVTAHKLACLSWIKLMEGDVVTKRYLREELVEVFKEVNSIIMERTKSTSINLN